MKVLAGIAETEHTAEFASAIERFPWPLDTEFRILSLREKVHPSMLEVMGTTVDDVQLKADLQAEAGVSSVVADLRQAGFAAEEEIADGDPAVEIAERAKRWGADLIVVGAEREGRIKQALLGSVATAVVKNASCNVLVIRSDAEA
jgi:nucleotide-binding universal stress UspA family protein